MGGQRKNSWWIGLILAACFALSAFAHEGDGHGGRNGDPRPGEERPANQAPVVAAWAPRVAILGSAVQLSTCASDPDGDALTYEWTLKAANSDRHTSCGCVRGSYRWQASHRGLHLFNVIVTDSKGASACATAAVLVNAPPSAGIAGPRCGAPGVPVTLTATARDADGDPVTLAWFQSGGTGPSLPLPDATGATLRFVPPAAGSYLFTVLARDGKGGTGSATFAFLCNSAPFASAGAPGTVLAGRPVLLQGCGQDPDGDALGFQWDRDPGRPGSGVGVEIRNRTCALGTFTPPKAGTYNFRLTVSDSCGARATDTVSVVAISRANRPPKVCVAPPPCAVAGSWLRLSGSATDEDGDAIAYAWSWVSGPGKSGIDGAARSSCRFLPGRPGKYVFKLTATDGCGGSGSATVSIDVGVLPRVWAKGPACVGVGDTVTLSGGADGHSGAKTIYTWSRDGGNGCAVGLSGSDSPSARFVARAPGVYRFRLRAGYGGCAFAEAVTTVVVSQPPAVWACEPQIVRAGERVHLKGRARDPRGLPLLWKWSCESGPDGSFELPKSGSCEATFVPRKAGTHVMRLTVTNGQCGGSASANTIVVVRERPRRVNVHAGLGTGSAAVLDLTTYTIDNTAARASLVSTDPTPIASFRITVTEGRTARLIDVDTHLGFVNEGRTTVSVSGVAMALRYKVDGRWLETYPVVLGDASVIRQFCGTGAARATLEMQDDSGAAIRADALPALGGQSAQCFRLRGRFEAVAGSLDASVPIGVRVWVGLGEDGTRCDCREETHRHARSSVFDLRRELKTGEPRRINQQTLLTAMLHSIPDATLVTLESLQVRGLLPDGSAANGLITSTASFQQSIRATGKAGSQSIFAVSGPVKFVATRCGSTPAAVTAALAGSGDAPAGVPTIFGSPATASTELISLACQTSGGGSGGGTGGGSGDSGGSGSTSTAPIRIGDFVTYTQGGWGTVARGQNPGTVRDAGFPKACPAGLAIGGRFQLLFTSSRAVEEFLPQGGTPSRLTTGAVDPLSTSAGVLGGQVGALALNVLYSGAGVIAQRDATPLGSLVIASGKFAGTTVGRLLEIANQALGGDPAALPTEATLSDLNEAATAVNECFDNGATSTGFLRRP